MPVYFLTWTTYGTWLHGDQRGSRDRSLGFVEPAPRLLAFEQGELLHDPVFLSTKDRRLIGMSIRSQCRYRDWRLDAVNVRTNHVHVVCGAAEIGERVLQRLKAYATRSLREHNRMPAAKIWTRRGSVTVLNDEEAVAWARNYVLYRQ